MADQPARLEAATVRAEVGSNIVYRFANDAASEPDIPTLSGEIPNLSKIILTIQQEGADKISFSTRIYQTTEAGIAATSDQEIFLVQTDDPDEIYAVWQNVAGTAVDTGKRSLSAAAVIAATQAASDAATAAQESADDATARVARFLAPSSVEPVQRDNGQPLEVGDQWPNSSDGLVYNWNGADWIPLNESVQGLTGDLLEPSNSLIGFIRGPFGGNPLTVRGMLSSQMLAVTEFQSVIPSGDKPDPGDPSSWYWDSAINAAMQKGKMVYLHNMVKIKRKISSKATGAQLIGDGVDSAGLILDSIFEGDCAVQLGDSSSDEATTTHIGIQGVSIFMAGKAIPAVTMLGCRDSSYARGVYIRDFSGVAFKTNKAGNGSGNATGKMCQGMKIEQVVAFPQRAIAGDIFLLDGIFESDISICKAFGYTLAENTAVGFSVGKNTESRGVKMSLCSAANMVKGASPVNPEVNVGVMYGQWARDCWDYNTSLENVEGVGVVFNGGTASGLFLPLNCRSVDARPFASANMAVLNPLYSFEKANACFATGVNYFSTVKCTFDFTDDGPVNCWGGMDGGGVNPDALVSSGVIRFGPLAPASNFVEGHSSDTTTRKEFVVTKDQQFYRVLPNGASEQTDQFYTTHNMGPANRERWRNSVLAVAFIIDGNEPDSGQTAISVRVSKSGVPGTDRVLVGAPDSGGTGYRTLRIPN